MDANYQHNILENSVEIYKKWSNHFWSNYFTAYNAMISNMLDIGYGHMKVWHDAIDMHMTKAADTYAKTVEKTGKIVENSTPRTGPTATIK